MSSAANEPVVARATLALLAAETDAEFVREAVLLFRKEAEALLALLDIGMDQRRAVHTLSSSAALVGAERLAAMCMQAELDIIAGRAQPDLAERIRVAAQESFTALDEAAAEITRSSA